MVDEQKLKQTIDIIKAIQECRPNRPIANVSDEICYINSIEVSWESVIVNVTPLERDLCGLPYEVYLSEVELLTDNNN